MCRPLRRVKPSSSDRLKASTPISKPSEALEVSEPLVEPPQHSNIVPSSAVQTLLDLPYHAIKQEAVDSDASLKHGGNEEHALLATSNPLLVHPSAPPPSQSNFNSLADCEPQPKVPKLLIPPREPFQPHSPQRSATSARNRRLLSTSWRTQRGSRSARAADIRADPPRRSPRRSPRASPHTHTNRRCLSAALGRRLNIELLPSRFTPAPSTQIQNLVSQDHLQQLHQQEPDYWVNEQQHRQDLTGHALKQSSEPLSARTGQSAEVVDPGVPIPQLTFSEIRQAALSSSISQAITSATCDQLTTRTVTSPGQMSLLQQKQLQWIKEKGQSAAAASDAELSVIVTCLKKRLN